MPAQSDDRVWVFLLDDHEVVREGLRSLIDFDRNCRVAVPGAGHLFAEPGALADVADLAVQWFTAHLPSSR